MTTNIIHSNNGSMVKDLFLKHEGEGFKPSHLHPRLVERCLGGLSNIMKVPRYLAHVHN
jgi:hypothetical protein